MELSLQDIASLTQGQIIKGSPTSTYHGLESLDQASSSEVSFLGNPKYESQFQSSSAGAVLVSSPPQKSPKSMALIQVNNPTLAFSKVIAAFKQQTEAPFSPGIHPSSTISSTAQFNPNRVSIGPQVVIEDHAVIGDYTRIQANCTIGSQACIGQHSHLFSNVSLREHCILGNHVTLQPGVVVGSDGYGYELQDGYHVKIPQVGIVRIHDHVEIGSNTTIDRARFGETIIGEGTKIDNLVQIGHNVIIGRHCLIIAQTGIAGSSKIGDYSVIAAQSGVAGHLTIGEKSIIGARSGVMHSLEGNQTYWGIPAKPIMQEKRILALLQRLPTLFLDLKRLKNNLS